MVESDANVGYVRNPTGSDYQGTKPGSLRLKAKKRNESVRIDVGKSASHQLSQFEIGGDKPCSQQLFGIHDSRI